MSYFMQHITYIIALFMCCHGARNTITNCTNTPDYLVDYYFKDKPGLCVGISPEKKTGTLTLSKIETGNCKDILAQESKVCTQGEFIGCCNGTSTKNCLDTLDSSNFVPCSSPRYYFCAKGKSLRIDRAEKEVCFAEYSENKENTSPYYHIVNKVVASGGCSAVLSARKSLCPHGNFIACCDGATEFCLNTIKKADFVACTLDVKTPCTSMVPSFVIGRNTRDLVCTGFFASNENNTVPYDFPAKYLFESTRDCKVWVNYLKRSAFCPQGHYVACCNSATAFCLDTIKNTDFVSCTSPYFVACSSKHPNIQMRKNSSVCLTVFDNQQKGTVGRDVTISYATCKEAKEAERNVCFYYSQKFYVCCEGAHCLDGAKSEHSIACNNINCLHSKPKLVLKDGKGACIMIKKRSDIMPTSGTSLLSDCLSLKKLYCSAGYLFYCCKTTNCLSGAESKLDPCSSQPFAAASFALDFVFLFANLILVHSCFTM